MIYIRTQASEKQGFGHLSRCLKLAAALRDSGEDAVFLCPAGDRPAQELIRQSGLAHVAISDGKSYVDEVSDYPDTCRQVLADLSDADNVAGPNAVHAYVATLRAKGIKVFYIDGAFEDAVFKPDSACLPDVLIQPYVGVAAFDRPGTKHIAGGAFAILPAAYQNSPTRKIAGTAQRILVSFGGSDPQGLTQTVMQALAERPMDDQFRLMIGPYFSETHRTAIRDLAQKYPGQFDLREGVTDMIPHYRWADLVVTSSGLSRYESVACGAPTLFCALYPAHVAPSEAFVQAGIGRYIGLCDTLNGADWSREIEALAGDQAERRALSRTGQKAIDGKGMDRLLEALKKELVPG
ncbi:PseG/SpsG family protein [Roseibium sp.]|uniref:PseG/SpsG family protein n=1 Tax=Roseibium sp. TaxID=1936156 RepID=UPI003A97DF70